MAGGVYPMEQMQHFPGKYLLPIFRRIAPCRMLRHPLFPAYLPPISRLYFETLRFTFSYLFLMADMLVPGRSAQRDARCDPLQNIHQLLKGEVSVRSSSRSSAPNPRRARLEVR